MAATDFSKRLAQVNSREDKISLLDSHAEELFDKQRYREASKYYSAALKLERRQNVRAYFSGQLGICYYNLGNDGEARKYLLRSASQFDPEKPDFMPDMYGFIHFHLGSLYEYKGEILKSLKARKVCEQYVESQEKDTRWMLYSGISRNYEVLGRHSEAIEYSQKAIQVLSNNDPGLAYLYESMGNNYMSMKQYSDALQYFSKVLQLEPDFERQDEIYVKVANCYHNLTNERMALETYQKMLELKEITGKKRNLTWLYARIAECHFRLEQHEQSMMAALEALRRRTKNHLEKAELRSYLTTNHYELGRYRDAVVEGEKTLKLARDFRNNNEFFFRMALSYHKLGDRKSFAKYRKLCREMFPEDNWNKYLDKLG